jgi:hypothetical protein
MTLIGRKIQVSMSIKTYSSSSDDSVLFPPRCKTMDDLERYQHIFDSNECKVLSTKTFLQSFAGGVISVMCANMICEMMCLVVL